MPAATLITSLPTFVTVDEYKTLSASTPSSFGQLPVVLRHKEENVSVTLEPALDGFSTDAATSGTLYILESVLIFMSTTGRGIQVEYPAITLHAVSRGDTGPQIYCQLDEHAGEKTQQAQSGEEEEDSEMRELIVVPQNAESLDTIFETLSICASLHPDPTDPSDEDEMAGLDDAMIDGQFETFTGTEDQELSEIGRAALAHLESIIYDPHAPKKDEDAVEDAPEPKETTSEKST